MKPKSIILAIAILSLLIIQGTAMEAFAGGSKKKKKTYKYKLVNKTNYAIKITDSRICLSNGCHNFKKCLNKMVSKGKSIECQYKTKKDFKKALFQVKIYRTIYPDQDRKKFTSRTGTWKITSSY